MSDDLVATGGGAVVPSAGAGGAVGEHVGDMSVDRGGAAGAAGAMVKPELLRGLEGALGFEIGPEQFQKAFGVLNQQRYEEDERQKNAAAATMRREWGASGYEQKGHRIVDWLRSLPGGLGQKIRDARDESGNLIANDPAMLRAMYEVAAATILGTDDQRDIAACERVLQAEWKGAYHSHINTIKRFLATLPQSIREGLMTARSDDDVAVTNDPAALRWLLQLARPRLEVPRSGPAPDESAIKSERRREIEAMMSDRDSPYWRDERVQTEYRGLLERGVPDNLVTQTKDEHLSRRIGEIERWMGAHKGSSEYKRYWDDPAVQREYAELLGRRNQLNRSK